MRSKISSKTTKSISTSSVPTDIAVVGSDAWMIERGFRETTPEEDRKFAKFFPDEKRSSEGHLIAFLKRVVGRK
jgi:hypothetical protein